MNPYTKILERLDALPEEERRLAARKAWNPDAHCGCLFGTVVPDFPREKETFFNFAYAVELAAKSDLGKLPPSAERDAALPWLMGLGLTVDQILHLQTFNDTCFGERATHHASAERYARVRVEVARLASEWEALRAP